MSNQVKIFVVAHKPFGMPEGEALVPIHVGRAASRFKDEMAGMIGDDTGENISEKNPSYCEMTAHYWIWKNVKDCDFVGVCHYRGAENQDCTLFADSGINVPAVTETNVPALAVSNVPPRLRS